ncbi:MAG: O-methyltransferase-domain-containing protein [Monoraphidium minutum]|nr:MAG: O-methyltransferase-domain-containing protein [Monoraphidium minutum]
MPPVALVLPAALALAGVPLALLVIALLLVSRPWDPSPSRTYAAVRDTPYPVFWLTIWFFWAADQAAALKPAPFRVSEVASAYVQSQARRVLFAVANLGIPDLLHAAGRPQTAKQLVAAIAGGRNQARARVCAGAAPAGRGGAAALAPAGAGGAAAKDVEAPPGLEVPEGAGLAGDAFSLNALSAALVAGAPCGMAHFGVLTGRVPFDLSAGAGGGDFWERLRRSPRHAATFDGAMRQKEHLGGAAAVKAGKWGRFDHVVDVAGGNGQLLARLLAAHPRLRGTLFDQPQQVARGKEWWAREHADLLPRAAFVAGDMFDAATIPAPAVRPGGAVAFVLSDILHDWGDAAALSILRALRARAHAATLGAAAAPGAAAGAAGGGGGGAVKVRLLIVEATLSDDVLPCLLKHRHVSDVTMLSNFAGGKERGEAQLAALLGAAGWRLARVAPAAGLMCVVEAAPV